jgi:hypothetical protein
MQSEAAGIGDQVEAALSAVGITKERVTAWIGRPCGCQERQEKLNALGFWARRVLQGKIKGAQRFLEGIMSEE